MMITMFVTLPLEEAQALIKDLLDVDGVGFVSIPSATGGVTIEAESTRGNTKEKILTAVKTKSGDINAKII